MWPEFLPKVKEFKYLWVLVRCSQPSRRILTSLRQLCGCKQPKWVSSARLSGLSHNDRMKRFLTRQRPRICWRDDISNMGVYLPLGSGVMRFLCLPYALPPLLIFCSWCIWCAHWEHTTDGSFANWAFTLLAAASLSFPPQDPPGSLGMDNA